MAKKVRVKSRYKARTPEQKARRQELWVAQEAQRRDAANRRHLARYEELRVEMARHGSNIGPIDDLQAIDEPERYAAILKARVERWDALWSITKRKKDTRGKIIIGGAILAELADLDFTLSQDQALLTRLVGLLDKRVERVRDRTILRYLLTAASHAEIQLSLRTGGPLDEDLKTALHAAGENFYDFDRQALNFVAAGDAEDDGEDEDGDTADGEKGERCLELTTSLQAIEPEDADGQTGKGEAGPASVIVPADPAPPAKRFYLKEPDELSQSLEKLSEDFGRV